MVDVRGLPVIISLRCDIDRSGKVEYGQSGHMRKLYKLGRRTSVVT